MTLSAGTRLGPYEITAQIGAGGMGEVYRARDGKLNRDVALKTLPEAFALDEDRLLRFKREAQVLASLNHPNIAAIYGFEDSGGIQALVLELVEGPTLAERIAQGPGGPEGPPLRAAELRVPVVEAGLQTRLSRSRRRCRCAPAVDAGNPVALFPTRPGATYAATPDGLRFLINTPVDEATASPITVVLNWKPGAP